jgi:acyl transferase domain-containing protein
MDGSDTSSGVDGIAIIGMSCRFPGARNIYEFWRNLRDGVESVTFFSDQELRDSGIDPAFINDPNYVKAGCVIEDIDLFDASFFGYSPKEAETIDPQQRLFLECAWGAIEDAGYIPQTYEGLIGVFGGARMSSYVNNMSSELSRVGTALGFQALIGNDKDYITTRVSYKLNLRGPSVAVQSACSTSLVAVHLACESLRNEECDMALAGGAAVSVPQKQGYFYQEGMIFSPDGHCRAFDARAQGIIGGNGVGIVLLKRLPDALADGDHIYAVIKGSAVNNDGWSKVGYTAPSLEGQTAVISEALAMADVGPETITYIEAHGTGTELGDPMEVEALTRVFRTNTDKKGFCALGSVKTNFGHLDTAAGVASLIKTVLALKYKQLPPSLHFEKPNPRIDFPNTPFFVNAKLSEWKADGYPRRAGVSSFGIGGTNAHVVLEEAPALHPTDNDIERPLHLMTLSARSENALQELARRYETFLETHPDASLADVCFTANVGRSHFPYRLAVTAESTQQLRERMGAFAARTKPTGLVSAHVQSGIHPKVAFLFTGQGSQYVGMGQQLYYTQPTFRKALDRCAEILKSHLDRPLLSVIFGKEGKSPALDETAYTQPALFAIEYALAEMWRSWGIEPSLVMGHSVGEYVAACVAGVFSLEDGLKLIAARDRLIQVLPQEGEMAAVFAGEERVATAVAPHGEEVSIATVPMLSSFEKIASEIEYSTPQIGLISNITGQLVENDEVCEASYWRRHLCNAIRFALGMKTLYEQGCELFLEIGPSPILLGMGRKCLPKEVGVWLPSLRKEHSDWEQLLKSFGELYVHGVDVDWSGFDQDYSRRRMSLPTYPFERRRCWIEGISEDRRSVEPHAFTVAAQAKVESKTPETVALSVIHSLLGKRLNTALPIFETRLSCDYLPYMKDHKIYGTIVVGGTIFFEMAGAAAAEVFGTKSIILQGLTIYEPLIFPNEHASQTVQLIFTSEAVGKASFKILSRMEAEEKQPMSWSLHTSGNIRIERMDEDASVKRPLSFEKVRELYKSQWLPYPLKDL